MGTETDETRNDASSARTTSRGRKGLTPTRLLFGEGGTRLIHVKDRWQIRIDDYRAVYTVDDAAKTVTVMHVAHRREVYE